MSSVVKPAAFRGPASPETPQFIAESLARFAHDLDAAKIPHAVVERAKLHVLDCLGIALASTTYEFAHRMAGALAGLGGAGAFPVVGFDLRLPLRDSVHLNGTLIHGLDFDDTHSGAVTHCSASALATVLGQALAHGADGREALAAFLVAVEADARIGMAADGGFHVHGHHPTGLVGAFGAALAAGRLADLGLGQLAHAQGIVLSMASGSLEFLEDGAWTKRQHPGWAGVAGITAAAMADAGFQGPKRPYEGRYGLFKSHITPETEADPAVITRALGEDWELFNVAFKPFPACHFNHAFCDAALALRREHGLRPEDVAAITARIHQTPAQVVCEPEANKKRPQNSYDAQFSVHYAIAASLVRGRFTLDELDPEAIADPEILALAAKVGWEADPKSAFPRYYSGEVEVRTTDGRTLVHREQENRGSDAKPLSAADVEAKFWSNATRAVSRRRAERVYDAVMALDAAPDLAELTEALSPA